MTDYSSWASFLGMQRREQASLCLLVAHNVANLLLLRHSQRGSGTNQYLASSAVVLAEALKLLICLLLEMRGHEGSLRVTLKTIWTQLTTKESAHQPALISMAIPALLYALQNNLLYYAVRHLSCLSFQVTYQLKILITALFARSLLQQHFTLRQWLSLLLLLAAVVLVNVTMANTDPSSSPSPSPSSCSSTTLQRSLALLATILAALSSGFTGVYFEKMVKPMLATSSNDSNPKLSSGASCSLWLNNIKLGLWGLLFSTGLMLLKDGPVVLNDGLLANYTLATWAVVAMQSLGGLAVSVVVRFSDNIMKGYATTAALLLNALLSVFVFHETILTPALVLGILLVLLSLYLYNATSSSTSPIYPDVRAYGGPPSRASIRRRTSRSRVLSVLWRRLASSKSSQHGHQV